MTTAIKPTITIYQPGAGTPSRSAVIYGKSGFGKTTMLRTVPGRGLIIEVPQLEGSGSDVLNGAENISVTPVADWFGIEGVLQYLEAGGHDYKWVGIDTITDFMVLARRRIIGERKISEDPHKMSQPERGNMNALVEEMIYKLRSLPLFVFFLAQERIFGADNEPKYLGPTVGPGVLTPLVSGAMLVARLKMEYTIDNSAERQLLLAPSPDYYTKVRTRPGIIVPKATRTLDFSKLFQYFAGKPGAEIDIVNENAGFEIDLADVGGFDLMAADAVAAS